MKQPNTTLQKLDINEQKRLDELMSKHNEGKLATAEVRELDELSGKAHDFTMANARKLLAQRGAMNSVGASKGRRRSD